MSSSRRVESNAANRKTFRAQAASPYSAKSRNTRKQSSSANAAASAAAGEIVSLNINLLILTLIIFGLQKTSSSLASLLNMLNPFKRRNDPPKSLPQIAHQQSHESVTEEEQTEGNTEDEYDMMGGDDSRFVEDELAAPPSAASTLNKRVEQVSSLYYYSTLPSESHPFHFSPPIYHSPSLKPRLLPSRRVLFPSTRMRSVPSRTECSLLPPPMTRSGTDVLSLQSHPLPPLSSALPILSIAPVVSLSLLVVT